MSTALLEVARADSHSRRLSPTVSARPSSRFSGRSSPPRFPALGRFARLVAVDVRTGAWLTRRAAGGSCRPILVVSCLVAIALVSASCGGDDTSGGEVLDSAETNDIADAEDATASTVRESRPDPNYENALFASAYNAARDSYTAYSTARHEDYFAALENVAPVLEDAAAARAAARADASTVFDAALDQAQRDQRSALGEIESRRSASNAQVEAHRREVALILELALQEAELDGEEAYYVGDDMGRSRSIEVARAGNPRSAFGRIAGKSTRRLAFDETYLSILDAAIRDTTTSAEASTALTAARDAVVATVAAGQPPDPNVRGTVDSSIAAVWSKDDGWSNNWREILDNIEARIDIAIDYDIVTPATTAALASIDEFATSAAGILESILAEEEQAAIAAYEEEVSRAASARDASIATAERSYETTVAAAADAVDNVRTSFDFDGWVTAAFGLADAYVVLHDVATAVESEAAISDDGSLAAASAIEYANTLRRALANVADAANLLIDRFPRRTILEAEAEFARAAEALFLEADIFEDALDAARSRAEARARATSD